MYLIYDLMNEDEAPTIQKDWSRQNSNNTNVKLISIAPLGT